MAKPKSEPTAIQKAAEAARERVKKAKEAHEKAATEPNKKALEAAQAALKTAIAAENEERFRKVAASRTKAARAAIRNVGKAFNPKGYKFNKDQADKVMSGLKEAISDTEKAIQAGLAGGGPVGTGDTFAL